MLRQSVPGIRGAVKLIHPRQQYFHLRSADFVARIGDDERDSKLRRIRGPNRPSILHVLEKGHFL
jgi:hypothetical protein